MLYLQTVFHNAIQFYLLTELKAILYFIRLIIWSDHQITSLKKKKNCNEMQNNYFLDESQNSKCNNVAALLHTEYSFL